MCGTEEQDTLRWTSFPAAEGKWKAISVSVFLVLLFTVIYLSFGTLWFIISIFLLGGSVAPYFAVTRYKMTTEEVEVFHFFYTVRRPWSSFRSYYIDRKGVLLSPFPRPTRLENYRGLYLRFGRRRDEVMQYVEKMFEQKEAGQPEDR